MLQRSKTQRLINHARSSGGMTVYAAYWTVEQLHEPTQRLTDRVGEAMNAVARNPADPRNVDSVG